MRPEFAPVPPQNLDAEESVLGAMMIASNVIDRVADVLEGREFYRKSHERIYRSILAVHDEGRGVDAITVVEDLSRHDHLEEAGGAERVHELAALVPAASNVVHYAHIVRETWLLRGLIRTGNDIARLGWERQGEIEDLMGEADRMMVDLQGHLERKSDRVFTAKQLVDAFRQKLANPIDESAVGVLPPFMFMSPLMASRLYVLGGYQADGKTALAIQFLAAACAAGRRVGFHSIEMSKADLTDRLVSTFGIPYSQVRTGQVSPDYMPRLEQALTEVESWDFEVIDDEAVDPRVIRADQRRGKYDMLVIDHLHRIPIKDPRYERQELEAGVRRITNVAREFEIPVLLLAQLSRSGDNRNPFPRPTTANLKGSGAIEQEAAAVWFVWRKRDKDHNPGSEAEFIIAKNRFGPIGWQHLWFQGSQVKFNWQRDGS